MAIKCPKQIWRVDSQVTRSRNLKSTQLIDNLSVGVFIFINVVYFAGTRTMYAAHTMQNMEL